MAEEARMDKTDWKILKALVANSRQPLSSIAKKALISKQTCHYRMKRLEKAGIITKYKARINVAKLGFSTYSVAVRLLNSGEEEEDRIIEGIGKIQGVRWLVQSVGRWDALVAVSASSSSGFSSILKNILQVIGDYLLEYETSTILSTSDLWLKDRLDAKNFLQESSQERSVQLDKKDMLILSALQENSRTENKLIAQKIGLTPEAAAYRIRRLAKEGTIHSFTVSVNKAALGHMWFQVQLLMTKIDPEEENRILGKLKSVEGISYVVQCLGKWNFEIHIYCKNVEEFRKRLQQVRQLLNTRIRNYEVSIILKKHISTTLPDV